MRKRGRSSKLNLDQREYLATIVHLRLYLHQLPNKRLAVLFDCSPRTITKECSAIVRALQAAKAPRGTQLSHG